MAQSKKRNTYLHILKSNDGSIYPVSVIFFLSALLLLFHGATVYSIQYRTYDGLENMHRHATIQLLREIEQHKIPE